MSDSGLEALAAEQAVEAKLAEAGADQIRRHSFGDAPDAAPVDQGTPEEVAAEPPRNELGQFASTEPQETVAETPEPQAENSGLDPAVQAYLTKYGGDVDKALAGAVHLQRKAGEQSNELGDLRRMVDELSALRETVQADYQARANAPQPIDQATADWYDQQVMQNPHQALAWAQQQGNQLLIQRGLDTWKEVDPYGAAVYTNQLQNAQFQQQMEQKLQAAQQLPVDANVNMALQSVRGRNPQFTNYDEALADTLERYPYQAQQLQAAASSGDRAQLEGAIETLYALAERDTLRGLALSGPAPETTTASSEVVEPTTSETHEPEPEPSRTDQFLAAFRQEAEHQRRGVWVAE